MALDVSPGDSIRVSFTLTNTGSPVTGVGDNRLWMTTSFVTPDRTDLINGASLDPGAMGTNDSKNLSIVVPVDENNNPIPIPGNQTPGNYNLEIDVFHLTIPDPIASEVISDAVAVAGIYSAAISNISITKV